jgi:hypothetical protein
MYQKLCIYVPSASPFDTRETQSSTFMRAKIQRTNLAKAKTQIIIKIKDHCPKNAKIVRAVSGRGARRRGKMFFGGVGAAFGVCERRTGECWSGGRGDEQHPGLAAARPRQTPPHEGWPQMALLPSAQEHCPAGESAFLKSAFCFLWDTELAPLYLQRVALGGQIPPFGVLFAAWKWLCTRGDCVLFKRALFLKQFLVVFVKNCYIMKFSSFLFVIFFCKIF